MNNETELLGAKLQEIALERLRSEFPAISERELLEIVKLEVKLLNHWLNRPEVVQEKLNSKELQDKYNRLALANMDCFWWSDIANKAGSTIIEARNDYGLKIGLSGEELTSFSITPAAVAQGIMLDIFGWFPKDVGKDIEVLLEQLIDDENNSGQKLADEVKNMPLLEKKYSYKIIMVVIASCAKVLRSYKENDWQTAWFNACVAQHWYGVLLMHMMAGTKMDQVGSLLKSESARKSALVKLQNDPVQAAKILIKEKFDAQCSRKANFNKAEFSRKMQLDHPCITDSSTVEDWITTWRKELIKGEFDTWQLGVDAYTDDADFAKKMQTKYRVSRHVTDWIAEWRKNTP